MGGAVKKLADILERCKGKKRAHFVLQNTPIIFLVLGHTGVFVRIFVLSAAWYFFLLDCTAGQQRKKRKKKTKK